MYIYVCDCVTVYMHTYVCTPRRQSQDACCTLSSLIIEIQWNLSIEDTTGTQLAVLYTVEPLYRGHLWDSAGCPVYSGTSL